MTTDKTTQIPTALEQADKLFKHWQDAQVEINKLNEKIAKLKAEIRLGNRQYYDMKNFMFNLLQENIALQDLQLRAKK